MNRTGRFLAALGIVAAGSLTANIADSCRQKALQPILSLEQKLDVPEKITASEFTQLSPWTYGTVKHTDIEWKNASEGLDFARVEVYRNDTLVDVVAAVKINPEYNRINVFNGFDDVEGSRFAADIEAWQEITGASVMMTSGHYALDDRYYEPVAPILAEVVTGIDSLGKFTFEPRKLGRNSKGVRGMLVAEPTNDSLPKADLLDFRYDSPSKAEPYTRGVQHYPILLNREGGIRAKSTDWQANRCVVAKDFNGNIVLFATEGGFFTLYNFGRFLRESNAREDKGFNIHTAMNVDGGYEAELILKSPKFEYVTYGEFETYGPNNDASVFGSKIHIPGVIAVFPRK